MEKVHKIVFASLVVILLGVIIFVGVITNNKRTENVKYIVETVLSSKENVMLYLGSGKCTHCKYQAEEMSNLLSRYKFKYYYVDIDEVSNTNTKNDILTKLGLDIYNGVTFPALLVYNNGKLIDELSDVQGIDSIYDFITKNGILVTEEKLPLKFINYEKYTNLINNGKTNIVALTSYKMDEGVSFQTQLFELYDKYNLEFNVLYLDDITDNEYELLKESLDMFDGDVYIPTLIVVKDKDVLGFTNTPTETDNYIDFLKNINIINE